MPTPKQPAAATAATDAPAAPPPLASRPRRPLRNYHKEKQEQLSPMNRLALVITTRVGTMGFFLVIFTWTAIWLSWNFLGPKQWRFDPPMGSRVLSLHLERHPDPVDAADHGFGQNIQGAHAEARAEHDLEVNVKAEDEIEVILKHLEYQNTLLLNMTKNLDARLTEHIAQAGGEDA